jgi:hypothetical protein
LKELILLKLRPRRLPLPRKLSLLISVQKVKLKVALLLTNQEHNRRRPALQ